MKEFYPFFVDYIPLIISNVIVIAFFLFFQKNKKASSESATLVVTPKNYILYSFTASTKALALSKGMFGKMP